ncbi:mce-related protein [Fibrobacterales bacterium]|nr:mce-related protein [Fibrobacterales bacterium]
MFKIFKYVNWSELSGLIVGAVIAVAMCLVLLVAISKLQQEGILGKTEYTLYSDLLSGQGLHKGTSVQINGVDIGSVADIGLATNGLVRLELSLNAEYKEWISERSVVYATRDQNIISERVVNIDISQKGNRVLEDGEFILAGTAQDIETVLKTANELIDKIGRLVIVADTLLNMVMDTNATIGMLLGSRVLYNRLDYATTRLNDLLGDAGGLMTGVNVMFNQINNGMPRAIAFADTLSTGVMGLMNNLDDLTGRASGVINSLDTTMKSVGIMVNDLNSIMGTAGNIITDGSQTLNKADDFMGGVSKFWFIRNKIPQKDSVPLLGDAW